MEKKTGKNLLSNALSSAFRICRTLCPLAVLMLFFGCTAATVKIEKKVLPQTYEEVLFIPPKEDPRHIVPKVVDRLEKMGFSIHVTEPGKPLKALQGSGFLVSDEGHILTCAHVLGDEKTATVWFGEQRYEAELIGTDRENDLGLLKVRSAEPLGVNPLPLFEHPEYRMGQDVFTIGFPLSHILGKKPRLSKGLISSVVGVKDNPSQLQVSAQVQPGNSGGPLLDEKGAVIGIIQMTLNPTAVALRSGGAVPQNVNFAVKAPLAVNFIRDHGVKPAMTSSSLEGPGLDRAQYAVARIQAGRVPPGDEDRPKLVLLLAYRSQWDMWYRFNGFRLVFFDYETGQPVFSAGQQGNNTWTTEESVLEEAFQEIEKSFFPDRP